MKTNFALGLLAALSAFSPATWAQQPSPGSPSPTQSASPEAADDAAKGSADEPPVEAPAPGSDEETGEAWTATEADESPPKTSDEDGAEPNSAAEESDPSPNEVAAVEAPEEQAATVSTGLGKPKDAAAQRFTIPGPAERDDLDDTTADDDSQPLAQRHWDFQFGFRNSFVKSASFDPFSDDDVLTQLSVGVGGTLHARERVSVAVLGFWEVGSVEATAREFNSELSLRRYALGLEARYHATRRVYGYARLTPAVAHTVASLSNSSGNAPYESESWGFQLDAALGAALRVFGSGNPGSAHGLWALVEGGYGLAPEQELAFSPVGQGAPERAVPFELEPLSLSGAQLRFAVALTL